MRFVSTTHAVTEVVERIEPYDAEDDLLTLYFNARKTLAQLPANTSASLPAAGTGHGVVRIMSTAVPMHYILYLDQDIFQSREGEMSIETDKAFYIKEAVLKDVFLFGDLKVQRARLKESP